MLSVGSSGGSSELNEASVPNGCVQPKSQEMSKDFNSNGVNLSVTTEDIEVRGRTVFLFLSLWDFVI